MPFSRAFERQARTPGTRYSSSSSAGGPSSRGRHSYADDRGLREQVQRLVSGLAGAVGSETNVTLIPVVQMRRNRSRETRRQVDGVTREAPVPGKLQERHIETSIGQREAAESVCPARSATSPIDPSGCSRPAESGQGPQSVRSVQRPLSNWKSARPICQASSMSRTWETSSLPC